MEKEKSLMKVQMTSPMIQKAFETLDGMKALAQEFLNSQIIPNHFYDKGPDGKVDFTKGNVSKVVAVWIKGDQLEMHPMTSLQEIVPVNGLLSLKGDGAKALILKSGKIKPGSWKEVSTGSISGGDFEVTITATRADSDETLSRSFSVAQAKRAGLWIGEEMLRKQDGWKWKHSPWHKYPDRMIKYRALGFLARDLFPDVMNGTYTLEEAQDFPQDQSIVVNAGDAEVVIHDKEFGEERSRSLTSKAAKKIDDVNSGGLAATDRDTRPPETEHHKRPLTEKETFPPKEKLEVGSASDQAIRDFENEKEAEMPERKVYEKCTVMLNGSPGVINVYSEDELRDMDIQTLHDIIDCDDLMARARDIDPQKNTNKKLRTIILAKYDKDVASLIEKFDPEGAEGIPDDGPQESEQVDEGVDEQEQEQEQEAESQPEGNKYGIDVPETVDGKRSFDEVKTLFEDMSNMAGVTNTTFEQLIGTKFPEFQKYRTKEDFCYKAPKEEVNALLNNV